MTFRDLNNPDSHDGTRFEWNHGGPFWVSIRINGDEVYKGKTRKGDRMLVHFTPVGEWKDE